MARKKEKQDAGNDEPGWLVTFSDLMTLLLTFFVLLLSLASLVDEKKRLVSIGSLLGAFGPATGSVQPLTIKPADLIKEPGPMEDIPVTDLEPLKELIWEDSATDFDFQSNRFIQVFSVDTDVMFKPGQTSLTQRGQEIIRKIIPVIKKEKYPLLLTGHTSSIRSEFAAEYVVGMDDKGVDLSWDISLHRVLTVYRMLLENGVNPHKIRLEAFGRFRSRASNATPEGRRKNRRVEFILDRRESVWNHELAQQSGIRGNVASDRYIYNDFVFDLNATTQGQ